MALRDEIAKGMEIQGQTRRAAASFLQTEVDTSLTFAEAALSAGNDAEKRERDRANARKGYDTLLRLSRKYSVEPQMARDFEEKLSRLRSALDKLGEKDL